MSKQVSDVLFSNETVYVLLNEYPLFEPEKFKLEPVEIHTACYRGFFCSYLIKKNQLFLYNLTIRDKNGYYPMINSVKPINMESSAKYVRVELPLTYSGELLIYKNPLPKCSLFFPAAFLEGYKLIINRGVLQEQIDISNNLRKEREKIIKKNKNNPEILDMLRE